MYYFITIHWRSPRWISIQQEMIRKYTKGEYRVYAFLNGIDPAYYKWFDAIRTDADDPRHDVKLDRLAQQVLKESDKDDDVLIFLDGDAFPVAPLDARIGHDLQRYELMAIQRPENYGEKHPHPSFCATTIRFWRSHQANWRKGDIGITYEGKPLTDVGGELMHLLEAKHIPWKRMLRSNRTNLHELLFGVYDDLVYHHGTGFRTGAVVTQQSQRFLKLKRRLDGRLLLRIFPRSVRQHVRRSALHPEGRAIRRASRRNTLLSEQVYSKLRADPDQFIATLR